jgi:hypothetical protein
MNSTLIDGKVYRLMPALGTDKTTCRGCSFNLRWGCHRPDNWSPPTLPESCGHSNIVYVEYTDEGMAKYVAARMGGT